MSFSAQCAVRFPIYVALCCESGYAYLWAEERERLPCSGYSLFVLCAVGHTAQWLILDLTSPVNSSSTGMMSLSRVVVIPLFKRSRKASRSAVESVRD